MDAVPITSSFSRYGGSRVVRSHSPYDYRQPMNVAASTDTVTTAATPAPTMNGTTAYSMIDSSSSSSSTSRITIPSQPVTINRSTLVWGTALFCFGLLVGIIVVSLTSSSDPASSSPELSHTPLLSPTSDDLADSTTAEEDIKTRRKHVRERMHSKHYTHSPTPSPTSLPTMPKRTRSPSELTATPSISTNAPSMMMDVPEPPPFQDKSSINDTSAAPTTSTSQPSLHPTTLSPTISESIESEEENEKEEAIGSTTSPTNADMIVDSDTATPTSSSLDEDYSNSNVDDYTPPSRDAETASPSLPVIGDDPYEEARSTLSPTSRTRTKFTAKPSASVTMSPTSYPTSNSPSAQPVTLNPTLQPSLDRAGGGKHGKSHPTTSAPTKAVSTLKPSLSTTRPTRALVTQPHRKGGRL